MPIVADNALRSSPPRISRERERERERSGSISDRRTRRSRRSFAFLRKVTRASEGLLAPIFDQPRNGVKRPLPRTNRIRWRTMGTERMRATPRIPTRYANRSINQRGHLGLPIHYRNGSCQLARASPITLDLSSRAARSLGVALSHSRIRERATGATFDDRCLASAGLKARWKLDEIYGAARTMQPAAPAPAAEYRRVILVSVSLSPES